MSEQLAEYVARLHHVESVMARLGVGRSKIFELIASGELRSVKVGRRRLVSEAALTEFIESLDAVESKDDVVDAIRQVPDPRTGRPLRSGASRGGDAA
jgi:excisionase family DNA binding protein